MSRKWEVLYNIMLIASSTYGLTRTSLRSKKFAIGALALYCASGWLGLANAITNSEIIEDVDSLLYGIANTAGVDLFVADVCITSGVDPNLSCMILIPPALDLFMMYVVNTNWSPITNVTHLLSVALFYNFAIRDGRPILIVAGMSFLFAEFTCRHDMCEDVIGYNAIAAFSTTWFLEGKDFKEFGF